MNHNKATMAMAMLTLLISNAVAAAAIATSESAECKKERTLGIIACKLLAHENPPSPHCCELIRKTHPDCVCPLITPEVAAKIDIRRALDIAEACGLKIPLLFQCGSVVIPWGSGWAWTN